MRISGIPAGGWGVPEEVFSCLDLRNKGCKGLGSSCGILLMSQSQRSVLRLGGFGLFGGWVSSQLGSWLRMS